MSNNDNNSSISSNSSSDEDDYKYENHILLNWDKLNHHTENESAGEDEKNKSISSHFAHAYTSYFHNSIQKQSWGTPKLPGFQ